MTNLPSDALASGDLLSDSMTRIATAATKQRKLVIVMSVILIAAALAASLYLSKRASFRGQASEALFRARTKLETEMKSVSDAMTPPPAAPAKDAKGKPVAKPAASAPAIEFAAFDVDAKLKDGIAALQKVAEDYPATLAGFDAKMQLGSLYFDHAANPASYEQALKWFDAAATSAPSNEQSIAALYSEGYAQEALGKCAEAVKTFDRALNSGSGPFLGELLRGKARCQETLGDKTSAKATYENIIKQLPNTENAKFAETKKATL
jgi:tetratricopeptide (TPR) repeat protein